MVFIRIKKVNDSEYYYLVKSQWDPDRKTSTQLTLKYLGKASDVTINDIPEEYRHNEKILSLLSATSKNQEKTIYKKQIKKDILEALKKSEVEKVIKIAQTYKKQIGLEEFYDSILKNVMYEIGRLWQQGQLDVGTEHICSNTVNKTIFRLNRIVNYDNKISSILICTPEGELHNIGCNMIESILTEKGYKVYNISPSVPSDIATKYIKEINPSLILISVTLSDILGSAKRLSKKIGMHISTPILIGGQAINKSSQIERMDLKLANPNIKIITDSTLKTLISIIKSLV